MKILTAFKQSSVYHEAHVDRLAKQVKEYSGIDLIVIDDSPYDGWWCKISCFREHGPVLFFDLDTIIVGDLEPMMKACEENEFILLEKFQKPYIQNRRGTSGVMGWKGDMRFMLEDFEKNEKKYRTEYVGDDQYEYDRVVDFTTYWQVLNPEWIRSYKIHLRKVNTRLHPECRVVCYHGKPKGWQLNPATGKTYDEEVRSRICLAS